ncbi:MAG: hypothetical protein ACYDCN_12605 [Bacteroidia bacterium]
MKEDTLDMHLAVFTTKNVARKGLPIVRVYLDDDGNWQFFDAISTNAGENAMIVSLGEILKIDNSIYEISELKSCHRATRTAKNQKWIITEHLSSED